MKTVLFSLIGACILSPFASSQTLTWQGVNSTVFNEASSWSQNAIPGTGSTASFRNNFDGTISFSDNATIAILDFRNTASSAVIQSFDLNGFSLNATTEIRIGTENTTNHVSITDGALSSGRLRLGYNAGTSNRLDITGAETTFSTGEVRLGHGSGSSNNIWRISDGASVSTGLIYVGPSGSGGSNRLEILSGSSLIAGDTRVGQAEGHSGDTILISGTESSATMSSLRLGTAGGGTSIQITDGATFTINEGGDGLLIGTQNTSSHNQLLVSGSTMNVNGGNVVIGQQGSNNTFRLEEGSTVNITGSGVLALSTAGGTSNRIEIDNSSFIVGSERTLIINNGEVNLAGSSTLEAPMLILGSNGILSGEGTINGSVASDSSSHDNIQVVVGNGFGTLSVNGQWDNANLQVFMALGNQDLDHPTNIVFDHLDIQGTYSHGGSITIDLTDLNLYDSDLLYQLISWETEMGLRTNTNVILLNNPQDVGYEWRNNGLYITAIPEIPASLLAVLATAGIILQRRFRRHST